MNLGDEEFGRRDPTIVSGLDRTSNFGRNSRTETPKILHGGSPDISQQAKVIKNVSNNNKVQELKSSTPNKHMNSTDEDDNLELEVDEHVAFATNQKVSKSAALKSAGSSSLAKKSAKPPKKNKEMVK